MRTAASLDQGLFLVTIIIVSAEIIQPSWKEWLCNYCAMGPSCPQRRINLTSAGPQSCAYSMWHMGEQIVNGVAESIGFT